MTPPTRRIASFVLPAALLGMLALAGCGGSDSNPTAPTPPASETFNSGTLATNAEYVHFFGTTAGSYTYRCTIHSGMTGTVVVNTSGADSAHVDIKDNFFDPASVTVKPGAYVRWQNKGAMNHTATRP